MRRAAIIVAAVPMVLYAWVAASSAIYCGMASLREPSKWDMLVFPFTQIVDVWPWRNGNWLLEVIVYASAAIPGIVLILGGVLWWRYRWPSRPLYGASRWAGRQDMRRGGMRVDRSPFS